MCWFAECNKVHANLFLGNVKESEHEEQIIPAIVASVDQATVCGQLLEFALADKVADMSPGQPNVGTFGQNATVVVTQFGSRHIFFVSGFADILPFLLRVPETHTENSSVSSDMRATGYGWGSQEIHGF